MAEPSVEGRGGVPGGVLAAQVRSLARPLGERDFALLFAGQACSLLGDQLAVVALPFLVLGRATPRELGLVLAAFGLARALAVPLGGVLADRFSRARVMFASDAGRAVVVALVALVALAGGTTIWPLVALMGLLGAMEGLFLPPSFAVLPELVPAEQLAAANALSRGASNAAILFGPAVAGLVVAVLSPGVALAGDAVTFVVSAISLGLIRGRHRRVAPAPAAEVDSRVSFPAIVRSSRVLQFSLLITLVVNLTYAGMTEIALPVLSRNVLMRGSAGFGAVLAAYGAGALAGALLSDAFTRAPRRGTAALGLGMAQGLVMALVPFAAGAGGIVAVGACMALAGLTSGVLNVFYVAALQRRLPGHLLGRAMSLVTLSAIGANPVSVLAAGVLVGRLGPDPMFAVAGALIVVAFALGLLSPEFKAL
ncbi:MAG TPA: MFS transporter [Candidatus Dormibacteraeota bacterium]|nr:MFS transporter [Candidatus Dormibacteraeota bacterium]